MKKLLTILLLIFACTCIKAQKETANFVELFLGFSNCPQPNSYTFYLDKVSTIWAANDNFNPPGFFINEDPDIDNSIYPWYIKNPIVAGDWKGWNMVYSQDQYTINDTATPVFGYGLYKISTNTSSAHFYIDYRDDRIPYENVTHIGHKVDHWVKYDFSNNKFYISPISSSSSYTEISNGELIRFWELKQTNPALSSTSEFPDYWANCLAIIPSLDNHPLAVWGPYPGDQTITEVTHYEIWRKYGNGNWTYLDYVSGSIFIYEDEDLTIAGQQSGTTVLYKIRAVQTALPENLLSNYSNTASIVVSGEDPGKRNFSDYEVSNVSSLELFQNYPNPFNPSTTINYSIPENSYVTLKVYDILGNVVVELANERKEAGNYSVLFNASDLSSGLYFYTLRANGYSFTKKMILTK